jgi:hypothetical protein
MPRKKADDQSAVPTDSDEKPSAIVKSFDGLTLEPLSPSAMPADQPDQPQSPKRGFIARLGRLVFYAGLLAAAGFALAKGLLPLIPAVSNEGESSPSGAPKAPAYEIRRPEKRTQPIQAAEPAGCNPKPVMTDEEIAACRKHASRP